MEKLIIGSRGSDLALWQANFIKDELESRGIASEIKIIKTQGDTEQELAFEKMQGFGFFTKEIEEALLKKEIDIAVHSHKDLPTAKIQGLTIAAVTKREDPSELLITNPLAVDLTKKLSLKHAAIVGTSSARRKSQLLSFREDLDIQDLRGNVPTRIRKLREGKYDAIMLANAGVSRLGINLDDLHVQVLSPDWFIPAPAQGVVAVQTRDDDHALIEKLQSIHHPEVQDAIRVERKILELSDGGCQLPLGVYCKKDGNNFRVWASWADAWNEFPIRYHISTDNPSEIAEKALKAFKIKRDKRVFITRHLKKHSYLSRAMNSHGVKLADESLIEVQQVKFNSAPITDWIFFSSANSVIHFFNQHPEVSKSTQFAAIGRGTEATLREFGYQSAFTGLTHDISDTAFEFGKLAYGSTVLFPKAKHSLRSIQKQMPENTKLIDLDVYETLPKTEFEVPPCDILVFTSPSNVDAYFSKYTLEAHQQCIAMGMSTSSKLADYGVKNIHTPSLQDETGLAEAIFSL